MAPNCNFPIIATTKQPKTTATADETDSKNQLIKVERRREMTQEAEVGGDVVSQMLRQLMQRALRKGKIVEESGEVESRKRRALL